MLTVLFHMSDCLLRGKSEENLSKSLIKDPHCIGDRVFDIRLKVNYRAPFQQLGPDHDPLIVLIEN